ncbi:urea ABC transporter ATP-binding subunit UrtE [bacterium]|nr:urea ABC transporter ATP-binding subunit UrtE [bacterium]
MNGVHVSYDESLILRDLELSVPSNSVVALLGRNGVGKTTVLKTIMGITDIVEGEVSLDAQSLNGVNAENRSRSGIGYVPQGREIFPSLTVWENLKVSLSVHGKKGGKERLEEVYELFPVLSEMKHRKGGVLSGGQQQQLAIGRALLTNPSLLLLDEPTEGIQPSIIDQIEDAIKHLKKTYDMSILLVEQYLDFAKACADSFYIMERGSIVEQGTIASLTDEVTAQYLSV